MLSELDGYIEQVKDHVKKLKDLSPKDKLDIVAGLEECNSHIHASTIGWAKWLSSSRLMKKFSEEDLQKYLEVMREVAEKFLLLDMEATEKMIEIESKSKKKEEKNPLAV